NSDVAGGSTLGNLSTQKVSIKTCDVGCAQLAMHSSYETAGTEDTSALIDLFKAFLTV
ncbi:MAG: M18 family aminopeptidase, partial [Spirochaetales bacterium]|nr:M18 family aminopeptidase [Candidatus Physcosoma equi]